MELSFISKQEASNSSFSHFAEGMKAVGIILHAAVTSSQLSPFLGNYTFPISTANADCQQYFNLGVNFEFNFNQNNSQKFFALSSNADDKCAMCKWGLAWASGPFINKPLIHDEPTMTQAYRASQDAVKLASLSSLTAKEQGLIAAMGVRYPSSFDQNQTETYEKYASAMTALVAQFPADDDILVLAAESMMTLECDDIGYNFYSHEGVPSARTKTVISMLETINNRTNQPFARHLYIHITEGSTPGYGNASAGRAKPAADGLFRDYNLTDAQHLQHMAGHTYLHVGAYDLVVAAGLVAVDTDQRYLAASDVGYGPGHNAGFLVYGAIMTGQRSYAYPYSDYLRGLYLTAPDRADGIGGEQGWNIYRTSRLRFGDWEDILADQTPMPRPWPYANVLGSYTNGVASIRLGDFAGGQKYYDLLQQQAAEVNIPKFMNWTKVANITLLAAINLFVNNNSNLALSQLQEAITIQDSWGYKEPPPWHVPMRECLGGVQLSLNQYEDADSTFRQDLIDFPNNPYSLYGLMQAMIAQPTKYSEAQVQAVQKQVNQAWKNADLFLYSSCMFFDPL